MKQILIYGCGNMGGAIARAVEEQSNDFQITLLDSFETETVTTLQEKNIPYYQEHQKAFQNKYDIVLLAVKPQQAKPLLEILKNYKDQYKLLISIMAGVSFTTLESYITNKPLLRAMPNTPCAIGQGATAYIGNQYVDSASYQLANSIFKTLGLSFHLQNEDQINSFTAIAGSGPAYIFFLTEILEQGAITLGLPKEIAEILAKQTVYGSALLSQQSPDSPSILRKKVTSPKGTTEAAITSLQKNKLSSIFTTAFTKAYDRAKELS